MSCSVFADSNHRVRCAGSPCRPQSAQRHSRASAHSAEADNARIQRLIEGIKKDKASHQSRKSRGCQDTDPCKKMDCGRERRTAAKDMCCPQPEETSCQSCPDERPTCSDSNQNSQQHEKIMQKLECFEETNRSLSDMLREQRCQEEKSQRLADQKDALAKKLGCCDSKKSRIEERLCQKDKEIECVRNELCTEKELAQTAANYTKFLQCTKAQLEKQLQQCEEENRRLCAELQEKQNDNGEEDERSRIMQELEELKQRSCRDNEDLKKAACNHKKRAERCEECLEKIRCQVKEKDAQLEIVCANVESWKAQVSSLECDKNHLEKEIVCLCNRVQELIDERKCIEQRAMEEQECLREKLQQCQSKSNNNGELERLKTCACRLEESLRKTQEEVQQLKCQIQAYENAIEEYKCQIQRARSEVEELYMKIEDCCREKQELKDCMNREVEALRRKFRKRVEELEQLPEMLQTTECKLQESQQQLQDFDKKNSELSCMISELRQRVKAWKKNSGSRNNCCESSEECDSSY